jgi:hypothetical protein
MTARQIAATTAHDPAVQLELVRRDKEHAPALPRQLPMADWSRQLARAARHLRHSVQSNEHAAVSVHVRDNGGEQKNKMRASQIKPSWLPASRFGNVTAQGYRNTTSTSNTRKTIAMR